MIVGDRSEEVQAKIDKIDEAVDRAVGQFDAALRRWKEAKDDIAGPALVLDADKTLEALDYLLARALLLGDVLERSAGSEEAAAWAEAS